MQLGAGNGSSRLSVFVMENLIQILKKPKILSSRARKVHKKKTLAERLNVSKVNKTKTTKVFLAVITCVVRFVFIILYIFIYVCIQKIFYIRIHIETT